MKKIPYTLFCFFSAACVPTKFAPNRGGEYGSNKIIYDVHCQQERQQDKNIALKQKPSRYSFKVNPYCKREEVAKDQKPKFQPLNIVFVVDRSQNMKQHFATTKGGISLLAETLEKEWMNAQFAAIGFRDYINDFSIISFTSAQSLKQKIAPWKAEGGAEPQQAGMEAIRTGKDLLVNINKNPQRKDSENVLMYISNSVAYWSQSKHDFSISKLVTEGKNWLGKDLQGLKFYYSIPTNIEPKQHYNLDAPSPLKQIQDFVNQSGISAIQFPYPTQEDVLNEFYKESIQVTSTDTFLCQAADVIFESISTSGVRSRSVVEDTFSQLQKGKALEFETSPDPNVLDYRLTINRCCANLEKQKPDRYCSPHSVNMTFKFMQN